MNKQEQRIIEAARNVLLDWTDGNMLADISGNFLELENAFNDYEKPSPTDFNWQSFRNQAAKDILCKTIDFEVISVGGRSRISEEKAVRRAISYADELIRQLKEKEEK